MVNVHREVGKHPYRIGQANRIILLATPFYIVGGRNTAKW